MNAVQLSFIKSNNSLARLLVQIELHADEIPAPVKLAFDELGSDARWGCHCDLEPGMEPDGCVIDDGRSGDCVYASKNAVKQQCEYWRPIQIKL